MKLQTSILVISLWLCSLGCEDSSIHSLNNDQINKILSEVNEDDPKFVEKGVSFDSILTLAGHRSLNEKSEKVKARFYFFGERTRGYYNLPERDDKNLQVFGKKVGDKWAIKCVTKLNMEEAGGYIILNDNNKGIWSNGHYNFEKGLVSLKKQDKDYDDLKTW